MNDSLSKSLKLYLSLFDQGFSIAKAEDTRTTPATLTPPVNGTISDFNVSNLPDGAVVTAVKNAPANSAHPNTDDATDVDYLFTILLGSESRDLVITVHYPRSRNDAKLQDLNQYLGISKSIMGEKVEEVMEATPDSLASILDKVVPANGQLSAAKPTAIKPIASAATTTLDAGRATTVSLAAKATGAALA